MTGMQMFGMLVKGEPSASGVHAETALGNEKPKRGKARNFLAFIGGGHKVEAPPAVKKHYNSVDELPAAVKNRVTDPTKRRQWMHVFNSAMKAHGDEGRAFGEAYSTVEKRSGWDTPMKVTKVDPDKHLVFGWASVAKRDGKLIVDKQGDIIDVPDLEAAAYDFVLFSREGDLLHVTGPTSRCVESMVFTAEKCAKLNIPLPKDDEGRPMEGWWVGFKIDSEPVWECYKRGELPEFSIGGEAVPVPLED